MKKILGIVGLSLASFCCNAQQNCSSLANSIIPSSAIKLATNGATVTSATLQTATSTLPQYCQVLGSISPTTQTGMPIQFEVNLPTSWNNKAVEYGGGGFNGTLITGLQQLTSGLPSVGLPLNQGFVTYGNDSGHSGGSLAGFASDPETRTNFAYAAYDKTHDVAMYLILAFYGTTPTQSYYFGHSEGGREALAMAQMFPNDYTGIVSMSPVIDWTLLQTFGNNIGTLQLNGGWLNTAKLQLLATATSNACDSLDGISDGVVSNYLACNSSVVNLQALECPGGTDTGNTCFSAAQLAELSDIYGGYSNTFPVANNISSYPGFLYGGEAQTGAMGSIMGTVAAAYPNPANGEGNVPWYGAEAIKFFITNTPQYNTLFFNPSSWQSQVLSVSSLMDMTNPDLSVFINNGGKLILFEGTSDFAQSPQEGMLYYQSIEQLLGLGTTQASVRFYISPGTVHNGGGQSVNGTVIPAAVDLLGALDSWVGTGIAPGTLTQYKEQPVPPYMISASRPLCRYGQYPAYIGGNKLLASSYSCSGTIQ